jgi:hypothetical protein
VSTTEGVLLFAGGVAVGLLIAKVYVESRVSGTVSSLLGDIGLGGAAQLVNGLINSTGAI